MKQKFSPVLALAGVLLAADAFAAEDWSAIRSHNITVPLTVVRRAKLEPFNLIARFVTEDRAKREFTVEFPANPPDAHVATIMNVIDHSVAWTTYRGGRGKTKPGQSARGWRNGPGNFDWFKRVCVWMSPS